MKAKILTAIMLPLLSGCITVYTHIDSGGPNGKVLSVSRCVGSCLFDKQDLVCDVTADGNLSCTEISSKYTASNGGRYR